MCICINEYRPYIHIYINKFTHMCKCKHTYVYNGKIAGAGFGDCGVKLSICVFCGKICVTNSMMYV